MVSLPWIFFIFLTIFGATVYNITVKLAGDDTNPFIFGVILSVFALIGHGIAAFFYWLHKGEQLFAISPMAIWLTIFAGLSIVAIDVGYFLAVKHGGVVASQTVWTVGALLLITLISYLFLGEQMSVIKLAGVLLGALSVILVVKG